MTTTLLIVASVLSFLIGLVLGTLGGGGAILMLPMLVYVVGVVPKTAIATSLVVVGATSLAGTVVHALARTVRWKIGLLFGAAAMISAFAGGHLARFVPETALLVVFATVMLVAAIAMLRPRRVEAQAPAGRLAVTAILALGAGVGLLSGLVGAGGGFLIVPALTLFGGLAMPEAIGTSLFVIALQSFAGFAGHARHVELDWRFVGAVTCAALVGSFLGAMLGKTTSPVTLRRIFGWLVLVMGLFVFAKQLPLPLLIVVAVVTSIAVLIATRAGPPVTRKKTCKTSLHSLH